MHKNVPSLLVAMAALWAFAVLPVQAAPASVGDQASGILGSPITQPPSADPAIAKAVEWLQTNQKLSRMQYATEKSARLGHDADRCLILGGPETLPM